MSKISLTDLANLENEASAVVNINANNQIIENAIDNTLSRDGTSPNQMGASLDMNSNRLINLPTPGGPNDPARKVDIDNAMLGSYSGQTINGTANQITASTVGTVTTLSIPNAITFTGKTITGGTLSGVAIGTPTSGVLTSCTGLPISTGVSGLGTGIAAFLATPSSANLIAAITDETGTGALVFNANANLTAPNIGVAVGTSLTTSGLLKSTGTAGVGYGVGAGGSVTQLTSRSTGVTLNKICGSITLFAAAGSTTPAQFAVANSTVVATDVIALSVQSASNTYLTYVANVGAGTFSIAFSATVGTASDSPIINFTVIKSVVT